eukprot:CAMPEP_0194118656 /NCGR_PEP_ID=MMETSP0150-20130528/36484_1 /TAXON_ID=122233 /ORGANISM="Chaetoceros debilis, Strain MM31A-1" /LENGTH=776 /DNA_ID=CAMNT_0038810117 /DNA_START=45 /DNA_END=2372 /DNA_ORIENTATION=-
MKLSIKLIGIGLLSLWLLSVIYQTWIVHQRSNVWRNQNHNDFISPAIFYHESSSAKDDKLAETLSKLETLENMHVKDEKMMKSLQEQLAEDKQEIESLTENLKNIMSEFTSDKKDLGAESRKKDTKLNELTQQLQSKQWELNELAKVKVEGQYKSNIADAPGGTGDEGLPSSESSATTTESLFKTGEICSLFPSPSFTASSMWLEHLPTIITSSWNPDMPKKLMGLESDDKIRHLLTNVLTPARLRRGISHLPTGAYSHSHDSVQNVMHIIEERIKDPQHNPPLRVAVFGGSLTLGRNCIPNSRKGADRECSWVHRFELLMNQFANKMMKNDGDCNGDAGSENGDFNTTCIVKVYNVGIGGTDSVVGSSMVKYWMYPDGLKEIGPDVIIHNYSTNDSLPPHDMEEDADTYTVVSNRIRATIQEFIRNALRSKPCSKHLPLIVTVDDYLGPQSKDLLGELSFSTVMTQLAKWYDFAAISYGDTVRDVVYENINDRTFFNQNDVHYGISAHQTIAWSVGFAALELVSNYCDDEYRQRKERLTKSLLQDGIGTSDDKQGLEEEIPRHQFFLPPLLSSGLTLGNITSDFNKAHDEAVDVAAEGQIICGDMETIDNNTTDSVKEKDHNPCPIAWISVPGIFGGLQINRFMEDQKSFKKGWRVEDNLADGWRNKVGWVAEAPDSTFSLSFRNLTKSIKTVSILYLRSYGEKWEGSRVNVTLATGGTGKKRFEMEKDKDKIFLTSGDISGNHNQTTSLTLLEEFVLPKAVPEGDLLNIKFDMI